MNETLQRIHDYLLPTGFEDLDGATYDHHPIHLALQIAFYAHRDQTRENGEPYVEHPIRCFKRYLKMIRLDIDEAGSEDVPLLKKHHIPYYGVQECCLLHDVIEDSELSLEEVEGIYVDQGLGEFFAAYIKEPLRRVTHIKSMPYNDYIDVVLGNPISAMVKMMDLQDNLIVLDLTSLTKKNYHRAQRYLRYIHRINSAYHFVENAHEYRMELKRKGNPN